MWSWLQEHKYFFGEDLPLLYCFDFAGGERGVQKLLFGFVWVEINSARQMVLTQNHLGSHPGKPFGKWRARSKNTWQVIEQSVYHWVWPAEPAGEANSFQSQMGEEGRPSPSELFFQAVCRSLKLSWLHFHLENKKALKYHKFCWWNPRRCWRWR